MTEADLGVEAHYFEDGGAVPNNPALPLLVYRQVSGLGLGDMATGIEARFGQNGWGKGWRNGICPFHHFHSNAQRGAGPGQRPGQGAVRRRLRHLARDPRRRCGGDPGRGRPPEREEGSGDLLVIGRLPAGR